MKKLLLVAAALGIVIGAAAQQQGPHHHGKEFHGKENRPVKENLSPEQMAAKRVEQMSSELQLTDKQVKKLNKFFEDDIKYREENFGHKENGKKQDLNREEHKKYAVKQEKKLKNILGDENYDKWRRAHPVRDRQRHHGTPPDMLSK